jgi:actin-related protein
MSDCLHCEINELVQQRLEQGETNLGELIAMIAESLVDLIQSAPEADQPNLLAHAVSIVGQTFLEKGGAFDTSGSAAH